MPIQGMKPPDPSDAVLITHQKSGNGIRAIISGRCLFVESAFSM